MAAYGTLVAWARAMGEEEAAQLLEQTLHEEKAADEKLSSLAEGGINLQAAEQPENDDEPEMASAARSKHSGKTPAKRRTRRS